MAFAVFMSSPPLIYDEINKVLTRLPGIPLITCLPSMRKMFHEMCPIKGPARLKQTRCRRARRRSQIQFECQ
jgi:hypothetical protein